MKQIALKPDTPNILTHIRGSKGLTQQAAADKAGMALVTWQRVESDPFNERIGRLNAVLTVLGIPWKEVLR